MRRRPGVHMSEVVTLTLPVGRQWVGVAELVLAGLGARLELPYDRVDELQLAVGTVLGDGVGQEVRLEATSREESVDVRVGPVAASVAQDEARRRVLAALADELEVIPSENDAAWVVLTFARGGAR